MSKVGNQYVIEVEKEFLDENNNKLYKIKGFNSLVFDENGIKKLTKYKPEEEEEIDHCDTCEYRSTSGYDDPCKKCTYCYVSQYKKADNRIRRGDPFYYNGINEIYYATCVDYLNNIIYGVTYDGRDFVKATLSECIKSTRGKMAF